MLRALNLMLLAALLGACASNIPQPIREAPPSSPSVEAVVGHVQEYAGTKVRWGGSIAAVDNQASQTVLEIVSRPLGAYGRPTDSGESRGRFLARYNGFLDPMVYAKDRLVTVVGTIDGEEPRAIGKFTYPFPVVRVENIHLWEPLASPPTYPPMYWYDPWWPYPYSWRYPYRHPLLW